MLVAARRRTPHTKRQFEKAEFPTKHVSCYMATASERGFTCVPTTRASPVTVHNRLASSAMTSARTTVQSAEIERTGEAQEHHEREVRVLARGPTDGITFLPIPASAILGVRN